MKKNTIKLSVLVSLSILLFMPTVASAQDNISTEHNSSQESHCYDDWGCL